MEIKNINDLYQLRYKEGLNNITVISKNFLRNGLFPIALKFSFWALSEDGMLSVKCSSRKTNQLLPNAYDFKLLIHEVYKILKYATCEFSINDKKNEIIISKSKNFNDSNWSFGIIFSGNKNELNQVFDSIEKINNLKLRTGLKYEVLICGPLESKKYFKDTNIKYVNYENDHERFLINKKKMILFNAMKYNNCCILHSRIKLSPDSILNLPENFDVITPRIYYNNESELSKDNDLIFYKWNRTLEYIVSASTFKDYDRDKYLSYYKDSIPYIDGGCIITKKSILQNVPLNENIAWGEAEDVEWSKRLFLNGYLVEVSKDSIAFTETTKTSKFFLKLHPKIRYVLRRIIHPIKVIWWKIS
tara:strand:- start:416 stop:1495 length:1080 start_codon:yes stop_codon:yes gene_type:complete